MVNDIVVERQPKTHKKNLARFATDISFSLGELFLSGEKNSSLDEQLEVAENIFEFAYGNSNPFCQSNQEGYENLTTLEYIHKTFSNNDNEENNSQRLSTAIETIRQSEEYVAASKYQINYLRNKFGELSRRVREELRVEEQVIG
ncbi:MAG: hypothetical protein ACOC1K_08065 [Nanoarchaeota archaeon]